MYTFKYATIISPHSLPSPHGDALQDRIIPKCDHRKKKHFTIGNSGKLKKIASRSGQVLDHQDILLKSILTGKIEGKRGLDRRQDS